MPSTYITGNPPSTSTTGPTSTSEATETPTSSAAAEEATGKLFGQNDFLEAASPSNSLFGLQSGTGMGMEQPGMSNELRALEAIVELVAVVANVLEAEGTLGGSTTSSELQPHHQSTSEPTTAHPTTTHPTATPTTTQPTVAPTASSDHLPTTPSSSDTDSTGLSLNKPANTDANAAVEGGNPTSSGSNKPANAAAGDDLSIYIPS